MTVPSSTLIIMGKFLKVAPRALVGPCAISMPALHILEYWKPLVKLATILELDQFLDSL